MTTTLRLFPVIFTILLSALGMKAFSQPCTTPSTLNMTLVPPQGMQWVRTLGGSDADAALSITAVSDTTFVVIGLTSSADGDMTGGPAGGNGFIAKYHSNGTLIWKKVAGGPGEDGLHSVTKADNGSVIVSGISPSIPGAIPANHGGDDVWLAKLDADGNILWQKMIGGSDNEYANSIIRKCGNDKYAVLSYTSSNDGDVVNPYPTTSAYPWLFVIDGNGSILSQKILSDTLASYFSDVQVTPDKGFILGGETTVSDHTGAQLLYRAGRLVKTDSVGTIVFVKTIYNTHVDQGITGLAVNADSAINFAGYLGLYDDPDPNCMGNHGGVDAWTGKVDKNGNLQWQQLYGGSGHDQSFGIISAAGGGHFIGAFSSSNNGNVTGHHPTTLSPLDAWVIKLDNYGNLEWQKTVGGDDEDMVTGLIQLPNNNIIATGYTVSATGDIPNNQGNADVLLFTIGGLHQACTTPGTANTTLTSPDGIQWLRALGGSDREAGYGITAVSDTTFVVTGLTSSTDGDMTGGPAGGNGFVAKYHTDGTLIWKKVMGGPNDDILSSVTNAGNGSIIVSGISHSIPGAVPANHGEDDVWLAKLDADGNVLWQRMLGGSENEHFNSMIRKFGNDKYVVLSYTSSDDGDVTNPYTDPEKIYPWLFIIDENGNILSQKVFPHTLFTGINDIQVTLDKGFIIGGALTVHNDNVGDYVELGKLVKTDSTGNILFNRSYNNPNYVQWILGVTVNADSSFTFAGQLTDAGAPNGCIGNREGSDVWVGKTDKNGDLLWQKFYGGSDDDQSSGIIRAAGGGYIISGETSSTDGNVTGHHPTTFSPLDAWAIKLDDNGNLEWQKIVGGNDEDRLAGLIQLPDNDIVFLGTTHSFNNGDISGSKGDDDVLVFKINAISPDRQFCPGGNHTLYAIRQGTTYQWQVDTGAGFINITDNSNYSGTTTVILQLIQLPSNWYGYRYRCVVDGINDPEVKIVFTNTWQGTINNDWHVAANWSCGTVPDENTDVKIYSGFPVLNSNATVRSLQLSSGAGLTVAPNIVLTVLH